MDVINVYDKIGEILPPWSSSGPHEHSIRRGELNGWAGAFAHIRECVERLSDELVKRGAPVPDGFDSWGAWMSARIRREELAAEMQLSAEALLDDD